MTSPLTEKINEVKKKLRNKSLPKMTQANLSGMIIAYQEALSLSNQETRKKVEKLKEKMKDYTEWGYINDEMFEWEKEIDAIFSDNPNIEDKK